MRNSVTTHEDFLHGMRTLVVNRAEKAGRITEAEADKLRHTRLMYGAGNSAIRGSCYYEAWENGVGKVDVVEIGAMAQENHVQLGGTEVHELGHVLAGHTAGHGKEWKEACQRLGFVRSPEAAGQVYTLDLFQPDIAKRMTTLAERIADGSPAFKSSNWLQIMGLLGGAPRPCSAGIGTRGGKSRGPGSGSRLRLYECECAKPIKVRVASDSFAAHCDICGAAFAQVAKA